MQEIVVEAPDGTEVEFPAGTDTETIERIMRENFSQASAPQPQQSPTLLDRAGSLVQGAGQAVSRAADAFTGADAPFDGFGEVGGRTPRAGDPRGSSLGTGLGFALTNDEARRVSILQQQYPDAEFTTDQSLAAERGVEWPEGRSPRVMARMGADEEYRFINAPGFSPQDAADLATGIVAFTPAGRLQAMGRSMFARVVRGGAAAGATQAAMDEGAQLFGADRGADPMRTGVAALSAVAAEPLVSLGGSLLRRRGSMADGPVLDRAGAATLNRNAARSTVAPAVDAGTDEVTEEAARRGLANEFGVRMTRGQQARQPGQIRDELLMTRGAMGQEARDEIRPFMQGQTEQVEAAARRFGGPDMPATQSRAALAQEVGENVADRLRSGATALRREIDDAYDVARSVDARFDARATSTLPNAARSWLDENDVVVDATLTPATLQAIGHLDRLVAEIGQRSNADEQVVGVSIQAMERARRQILNSIDAAANPADARAARHVREALDSWMDRAVDDALIEGTPEALEALRGARSLRARYGRIYSENRGQMRRNGSRRPDPAGRLVQSIVEDELTGTQVMNLLFGRSELGAKRGTARMVENLVSELGPDSSEVGALRQAFVTRMLRRLPTTEQPGGFTPSLAQDWRDGMTGSGAEISRALFTREERMQMARFTRLLEELTPPDGAGRTSGTAENSQRLLRNGLNDLLSRFPVAGRLANQVLSGVESTGRAQARRAITPPSPPLQGLTSNLGRAAAPAGASVLLTGGTPPVSDYGQ